MNSILFRPTRPCFRHAPNDWGMVFPPWVFAVAMTFFFTFLPQAHAYHSGTHSLLYSSAFCGHAASAKGFNPALLHDPLATTAMDNSIDAPIISGTVWWDQNNSGTIDYPELAIPRSLVQLFSQSDPDTPVASVMTDYLGRYAMRVTPGQYFLRNTTYSLLGENLTSPNPLAQVVPFDSRSQYSLLLSSGDYVPNLNFGELSFPTELITKRYFLTSSDPLIPLPEPGVWIQLFCAGMTGLMCFIYKFRRRAAGKAI